MDDMIKEYFKIGLTMFKDGSKWKKLKEIVL